MNNTPNELVTESLLDGAFSVKVISGEGENGAVEHYEGELTPEAIIERLEDERCGGDRWAILVVDGRRIGFD